MVTLPGARPPSPIHIQFDHPEIGSNNASSPSQPNTSFGFISASNSQAAPRTWSCPTSTPMIRNGGLGPNSSENRSSLKTEFWRLPDKSPGCRFRPAKRALVSNAYEDVGSPPQPKVRITEEKMLAQLRNFHITSAADNVNSSWFFMQKPMEMFDDIENRMSDDEEDESHSSPSKNNIIAESDISDEESSVVQRNTLAISNVLKQILEADRMRVAAATALNPCTDIVLWKPPTDFLKEIVPSVASSDSSASVSSDSVSCDISDSNMSEVDIAGQQMNSSGSDKMDGGFSYDSALYQRRNARQYSKPIINVLNLPVASVTSNSTPACDTHGSTDGMMDIDE